MKGLALGLGPQNPAPPTSQGPGAALAGIGAMSLGRKIQLLSGSGVRRECSLLTQAGQGAGSESLWASPDHFPIVPMRRDPAWALRPG